MAFINILDHSTIDQIAAGEVVERPSSIVKELVENAMDAEASAVTVEIRDGGISLIRVTDNGSGIEKTEIRKAFLRHATSKISTADDLSHLKSLGFRGEALSSIAAVSQIELITKTRADLTGIRLSMEGSDETSCEEIGAPDGTTVMVRNVFFNVPARKKFLKQASTEGGYIADLMEHLAMSHPSISFKFVQNGQTRFATSGNGNLKEVIYRIYGRDTADQLIPFCFEKDGIFLNGFLGKPSCNRSNRSSEIYFINSRYIKSKIISAAIEEGYHSYLMQHKYPFCVLMIDVDPEKVDVNVHPSKMEVRFSDSMFVQDVIAKAVKNRLREQEMIPPVILNMEKDPEQSRIIKSPEPFQNHLREQNHPDTAIPASSVRKPQLSLGTFTLFDDDTDPSDPKEHFTALKDCVHETTVYGADHAPHTEDTLIRKKAEAEIKDAVQMELYEPKVLSESSRRQFQILGQIFDTYWLVAFEDKLIMLDQHAAHEKVKYEKLMKDFKNGEILTQNIYPPVVLSLNGRETEILDRYHDTLEKMGFETDHFGGMEISVRTAPADLYGVSIRDMFLEMLDDLEETGSGKFNGIEERIATMACKAAVKGNHKMSLPEINSLFDQLLTLENPYFCPHGRPTMISFSQYEIDRKFKRIV